MGWRAREHEIFARIETAMASDPVSGELGRFCRQHAREPMPPIEQVTRGQRSRSFPQRRSFPLVVLVLAAAFGVTTASTLPGGRRAPTPARPGPPRPWSQLRPWSQRARRRPAA